MNAPAAKFSVGDLVDIKSSYGNYSGIEVIEASYFLSDSRSSDGKISAFDKYSWGYRLSGLGEVGSGWWNECVLFPHNPPAEITNQQWYQDIVNGVPVKQVEPA